MIITLGLVNFREEIILSDNKRLFEIPEYRMRPITTEVDCDKQQELWNTLLKYQEN